MATYYIGPNGDDTTGDGSESNPWLNLNYVYSQGLSSGDTVIFLEGVITQTENFSLNLNNMDITFIGKGKRGKCYIDMETNNITFDFVCETVNIIRFNNIYFLGGKVRVSYNFLANNGATFDFKFSVFKHIIVKDESDIRQPRNSMFGCPDINNATGSKFYLDNCILTDNYIQAFISNNREGKYFNSNYISAQSGNNCDYYVSNCTFYQSDLEGPIGKKYLHGIIGGSVQSPTEFRNCIFIDERDDSFAIHNSFSTGSDVGVINSYIVNVTELGDYTIPTSTNFFTDPLLVDRVNGFFEPRPDSPLFGSGII